MNTIGIVDDTESDRIVLAHVISSSGYNHAEFSDAASALPWIDRERPALLVLDSVMPGVSGIEVLEQIRSKYSALELPIIMISSRSDAEDIVEALGKGANDYVIKPFNPEIVLRRIATQIQLAVLAREAAHLKQRLMLDSMIATYHHEINNPLAAAFLNLELLESESRTRSLQGLRRSLTRIKEIVKAIETAARLKNFDFEKYASSSSILKISKE